MGPCSTEAQSRREFHVSTSESLASGQRPLFDGWVWLDGNADRWILPTEFAIEIGNSEGLLLEGELTIVGDATAAGTVALKVQRTAASTDQWGGWSEIVDYPGPPFDVGIQSFSLTFGTRASAGLPMPIGLVRVVVEATFAGAEYLAFRLRIWATLS